MKSHLEATRHAADTRDATLENIWQNPPKLTQEQLDRFITFHEYHVEGVPKGRRLIMRLVQLHTLSMVGRNLTRADLTGANLYAGDLQGADFTEAKLVCADFRNANAARADFTRAVLRGASFGGARLNDAKFDHADLRDAFVTDPSEVEAINAMRKRTHARFAEARSEGADGRARYSVDFSGCSMTRVRLEGAMLGSADLTDALLIGAAMDGANLEGARLEGAVLTGVNLSKTKISTVQLAGAVVDPGEEAKLRAASFLQMLDAAEKWWLTGGSTGKAANLDDQDVRVIHDAFVGRTLTGLSLQRAMAVGISFKGSMLQGAKFDNSDLRGADFSGADLRGASFRNARLTHAKFGGANLSPLKLSETTQLNVDFTGAQGAPMR